LQKKGAAKKPSGSSSEPLNKYSKEANIGEQTVQREKRQTQTEKSFPNGNSVCTLYLRADPLIYQAIYNNEGNKVNELKCE
jgi:hypothetical protein